MTNRIPHTVDFRANMRDAALEIKDEGRLPAATRTSVAAPERGIYAASMHEPKQTPRLTESSSNRAEPKTITKWVLFHRWR
jgi:hypothetical protein